MTRSHRVVDISVVGRPAFEDGMSAELILATEVGSLQRDVVATLEGTRPASMLDAGCGSRRYFGILADSVVGIDSDGEALSLNRSLTTAIHADLAHFDLGEDNYDVIVCWNVLEHVEDPAQMIARLARALNNDGLLILALSNVASVRGLVTRFTPTAVHRTVLRHVLKGGTNDPYPTCLTAGHHPERLLEAAEQVSLRPFHVRLYEGYYEMRLGELRPTVYKTWNVGVRLIEYVTRGRLDRRSDVLFGFAKGR